MANASGVLLLGKRRNVAFTNEAAHAAFYGGRRLRATGTGCGSEQTGGAAEMILKLGEMKGETRR